MVSSLNTNINIDLKMISSNDLNLNNLFYELLKNSNRSNINYNIIFNNAWRYVVNTYGGVFDKDLSKVDDGIAFVILGNILICEENYGITKWQKKQNAGFYKRLMGLFVEYRIVKMGGHSFYRDTLRKNNGKIIAKHDFDYGVDFINKKGYKVDIKTVNQRGTGRHNSFKSMIIADQVIDNKNYKSDYFLITTINHTEYIIEIIGFIKREDLLKRKMYKPFEGGSKMNISTIFTNYSDIDKFNNKEDFLEFIR